MPIGYLSAKSINVAEQQPTFILGMPDDIFIGVGASAWALIAFVILHTLIVASVVGFALRRLPAMPVVATNSAAISSCCHVASCTETELCDSRIYDAEHRVGEGRDRVKLAQSKIRWGAPKSEVEGFRLERLGFGTESDDISSPRGGMIYG
jgi:hypothetical protein